MPAGCVTELAVEGLSVHTAAYRAIVYTSAVRRGIFFSTWDILYVRIIEFMFYRESSRKWSFDDSIRVKKNKRRRKKKSETVAGYMKASYS